MILLKTEPQREVPVKTSSSEESPISLHLEWVAGLGGTLSEQLTNWVKRHSKNGVQLEKGVLTLPAGWMISVVQNGECSEATHVLDPAHNAHLLIGVFRDRPGMNYLMVLDGANTTN